MEPRTVQFVDHFILAQNVRVVIEAGTHKGEDTLDLARAFPNSHIYTFECNERTLPICQVALRNEPRVTLTAKALSDVNTVVPFYPMNKEKTRTTWPDGNQGASSLYRASGKYPTETYVQDETTVEAIRLDGFLTEHRIDRVDFLWLDTQGSELNIFKGLGERLKDVMLIQTEVEFQEQYANQPLWPEVKTFLISNGFEFAGFLTQNDWAGDALFVNTALKPL